MLDEEKNEPQIEVLSESDDTHELRCGKCGRHIATVITKHAHVSATCARKNCKKLNKFYIQGNKFTTEFFDKTNKVTY